MISPASILALMGQNRPFQQYQINEDIKKLNKKNQEIRQTLGELEAEIKQKK